MVATVLFKYRYCVQDMMTSTFKEMEIVGVNLKCQIPDVERIHFITESSFVRTIQFLK